MKTIPIWSIIIFAMSCIVLYTLGGFTINDPVDSEIQTAPIHIHQRGVPFQDSSQISINHEETKGRLFVETFYGK